MSLGHRLAHRLCTLVAYAGAKSGRVVDGLWDIWSLLCLSKRMTRQDEEDAVLRSEPNAVEALYYSSSSR